MPATLSTREIMGTLRYTSAFPRFDDWLVAASFKRMGGVSRARFGSLNTGRATGDDQEVVYENRRIALEALGIGNATLHTPSLIHTNKVAILTEGQENLPAYKHDAVVTNLPGHAVLMSMADCTPIFFADPAKRIAGLAHAGWQGVYHKISQYVLTSMRQLGTKSPHDVHVWVGPSIGPCCYQKNESDVQQAAEECWQPYLTKKRNGQLSINLWKALTDQLLELGICQEHLHHSKICTGCNTDQYFSYNKENGQTGRSPSIMCLR